MKNPDLPRCGAKNRQGIPCKKPPLIGKTRCKLHGGASTGAPKDNANSVTHGAYSSILKGSDLKYYERAAKELFGDAKGALLHSAAVMHASVMRTLDRVESLDDPVIVETKTVRGTDDKGNPIERTEERRIGVMGPVSDVLHRASSIVARAFDIDSEADVRRMLERQKLEAEIRKLEKDDPAVSDKPFVIEVRDFRHDDKPGDKSGDKPDGGEGSGGA